ncbi:MAG: WD40/YVTN/BNR-like repeat-containing protein [Bacteroidia bacterium]
MAQSTIENFYVTKARMDAHYDSLKVVLGAAVVNNDEAGYGQYQAWIHKWEPLVFAFHGDFTQLFTVMNTNMQARLSSHQPVSSVASNWYEVGPTDQPTEGASIGQCGSLIGGTGRINFVTIDPATNNNLIAGSHVGGLFYSMDGGENWANANTDLLPELGMSCCAIDPNNSGNLFAATGCNTSQPGQVEDTRSTGIFRSMSSGFGSPFTWQLIGNALGLNQLNAYQLDGSGPWEIKKLLIDPTNSAHIFVAFIKPQMRLTLILQMFNG